MCMLALWISQGARRGAVRGEVKAGIAHPEMRLRKSDDTVLQWTSSKLANGRGSEQMAIHIPFS